MLYLVEVPGGGSRRSAGLNIRAGEVYRAFWSHLGTRRTSQSQKLLAPSHSVPLTGPRTEGQSGCEGSGNSLDSGHFGTLAKIHVLEPSPVQPPAPRSAGTFSSQQKPS